MVLRGDCDCIGDCLVEAISPIPLAPLERGNRAEENWEVECWDDRTIVGNASRNGNRIHPLPEVPLPKGYLGGSGLKDDRS